MQVQLRAVLTILAITATLPLPGQTPQGPAQPKNSAQTLSQNSASPQSKPQESGGGTSPLEQSQQNQPPQLPTMPPLGSLLKKTVGFLTVSYQDGDHVATISGTAFFVFYEDKRLGDNQGFVYIVTNRHMAEPKSNGRPALVLVESLRVNQIAAVNGSQSAQILIPLGPRIHWYFPSDEAVDLAVIPVAPDQKAVDLAPFPVSMFATKDVIKEMNITEGDSVLFTGFFYQLPGQKEIEPIVRQGVLAMLPDEELITTLDKLGHIYLADVHVFGGNRDPRCL
jgi:hypothetical protein